MPNKIVIYPYNQWSEGAKLLSQALRCLRLRREGSTFRGNQRTVFINWGNQSLPREAYRCNRIFNPPNAVAKASDKIRTFEAMPADVPIPKWTTDPAIAKVWFDDGKLVVGRKYTASSEGKGVVLMRSVGGNRDYRDHVRREFDATLPLYTLYFSKKSEYRVHVAFGKAILVAQKRKREGEQYSYVRNSAGGWVFSINNVDPPPRGLVEAAIKSVTALGLDFGAVDVVCNGDSFVILEINTAPGIEGTTVAKYADAIKEKFNALA